MVCMAALATPQSPKEDDKKKKDEPAPIVVRAQLPTGWKTIGLSDKQKKEILSARAKYAAKRQALMEQIQKLKDEEMQECEKLLTDGQKKLLKERSKK
jgi:hypothetical protein